MKLSVTAWSFPHLTLKEVGGVAKALGLDGVDVGLFYASALDKDRILSEPEAYGAEVAATVNMPVANYYHLFGGDLAERNLALPSDPQNLTDLKAVLKFARAAGAPSIFILPGLINQGQSRREAFDASAEALKPLVEAGQSEGMTVTIEPHVHGLIESVEMAEEMVNRVPGLKLTLDLAHFVSLGYRQDEIETLARHAGHVHLRQAKQGHLQSKLEEGTINFLSLFGVLREAGYDGWFAIEYVHQAYMNTLYDDVLSETVKMRDVVRGRQG